MIRIPPNDVIYPDSKRPIALAGEISASLAQLPFVSHIYLFGSLVGAKADRWSDIDMIVVTQIPQQFTEAWSKLHAFKPILHHHPFAEVYPVGGHALGNVFVGESVFHCLDLNFLALDQHQVSISLERFGSVKRLYHNPHVLRIISNDDLQFQQELTSDEEKISIAIHFAKKTIKKVLRRQTSSDELSKFADRLKDTMQGYSFDYQTTGGNIGRVAQTYLTIADYLLKRELNL